MDKLIQELKDMIVDVLDLEDISPDEIESDAALFGDGLSLDSIDALEIGVAVQKRYGLKMDAEDPSIKEHFASVSSLARFIHQAQA